MIIVFLGAPGSGKSTQANYIHESFGITTISTGDILRNAVKAGTLFGLAVKPIMDSGCLVADRIMIDLVKDRIKQRGCARGFLLDGFPRTLPQAEAMKHPGVQIDYVVEIVVDDSQIPRRMSGRRVHLSSGRTYHIIFNPPKTEGKDDITGEELVQRSDDAEETVQKRLDVYHDQTEPLVDFYKTWSESGDALAPKYISISGDGSVTDIRDKLFTSLGKIVLNGTKG